MFESFAQYSQSDWSMDLSDWNVCNVINYNSFSLEATSRLVPPLFGVACES